MRDDADLGVSNELSVSRATEETRDARLVRRNLLALIGAGLGLGATQALAACAAAEGGGTLVTTSEGINKAFSVFESETYADLKSLNGGYDVVYVRGRTLPADGGEGFFAWVPGDTLANNDGTIIRPTTSPQGNWRRIYDGAINVRWFGAKGDASSNDGPAIQAAIDAAVTPVTGPFFTRVAAVYLPVGIYRASSSVTLKSGCRLTGDSMDASVIEWDGNLTTPGLIVQGETIVENLTLRGFFTTNSYHAAQGQPVKAARFGATGVLLRGASFVLVRDCTIDSWSYGIVLDCGSNVNRIERCSFKDNRDSATPQPVPTQPSEVRTVGILVAGQFATTSLDPEYPDPQSPVNLGVSDTANIVQIIGGYMAGPHVGIWHHGGVDHLVEGLEFFTSFVHVLLMGGQNIQYRNNYHEGGKRWFLGRNRTKPFMGTCAINLSILDDYYGNGSCPVLFVEAGASISALRFAGYAGHPETVNTLVGTVPGSTLFFEPGNATWWSAECASLHCNATVDGQSRRLINITPRGETHFASVGALYVSRPHFVGTEGSCAVQLVPLRGLGAPLVLLSQRLRQAPGAPLLTPILVTIPDKASVVATATFLAHANPSKRCAVYVRRMLASRAGGSAEQTPVADLEALGTVTIPVKPQILLNGNNLEFKVSPPTGASYLEWQVVVELTVCEDGLSNASEMTTDNHQLRWDGSLAIPSRV